MQPSELRQRFNDYLQLTQAANAAGKRDYLPESTKPGLLANLLTFGMAGAMDADYRRAYNAAIDRHNSGLNTLAAKQALDMTTQDMKSAHGDIGTQIQLLRLRMQMDQNEIGNLYRDANLGIRRAEFQRGELVPPPKTPEERAAHWDVGEKWIADPDHPNFGRWTKVTGGGGTPSGGATGGGGAGNVVPIRPRPPAPDSPLGKELGTKPAPTAGAPDGGGAAAPTGEDLTTAQLEARKAQQAAKGEVEKTRLMNLNEVETNGRGILNWLQAPDFNRAIGNVLPSKETSAATAGAAQYVNPWVMKGRGALGDQQTIDDVQYIKSGLKNIIPAIRALATGAKGMRINIPEIELLGEQWKRLAAGRMNREEAAAFKTTFIKVYNQVVTGLGGKPVGQESETSRTPTSTTPPSTGGPPTTTPPAPAGGGAGLPTSGTTRGGVTWRQVTP